MMPKTIISDNNKEKAGTIGTIEAIVKALNKHTDNAEVCNSGCGALWVIIEENSKKN